VIEPSAKSTRKTPTMVRFLAIAITLAVLWLVLGPTVADPDLWGHLRYGLDNLEAGKVLRTDVYSYLSKPGTWVNHEWLAEVSMGLAYQAGGSVGLVLLKAVLALGSLAAVYAAARLRGAGLVAACAALVGTALGLRPVLSPVRPQMFTVLGFSLLLYILVRRETRPSVVWWLVPVYIVWTNAHGGFLAGVAFLGLAVLIEGYQVMTAGGWRALLHRPFVTLAQAALAALAATLVNPYGLGLWRFLLRTATVPRPEIVEWQPLASFPAFMFFVGALIVLGLWAVIRSGRPRSPLLLAIYIVSVVMTTVAVRHLLFFALAWAVFHAEHVQAAGAWLLRPLNPGRVLRRALWATTLLLAVALWINVLASPVTIEVREESYPARAIALIKEHLPQGRLVIYFDWGQYALWHLGPEVQVSMDGRRETVYDDRIYQQSLELTFGHGDWDELLRQDAPDLVLVSKAHAAHNLMLLHPEWTQVYEDPLCSLHARAGSTLAEELAVAVPPAIPYDGYSWRFP